MRTIRSLLVILLALPAMAAGPRLAPDPRGIYLNSFTGGFAGTEWFQVTPIPGTTDRYRLADIHGGGFDATIRDGAITIDAGIGVGRFTGPDAFTLKPRLDGTVFTFESRRAPVTTVDFPLTLAKADRGNSALAGKWTSLTKSLNPQTGAVVSSFTEDVTLNVVGMSLRITDPNGFYFQGVFASPSRVVFRVVDGEPTRSPEFATITGSAINYAKDNFAQDMLGEATFADPNHFTATILLQTRIELGRQSQSLITFEAKRTGSK